MMTKAELEAANWQLAHEWADGLGLDFAGVSLGDLAVYSFLSVIGRIQLVDAAQQQAQAVQDGN